MNSSLFLEHFKVSYFLSITKIPQLAPIIIIMN